MASCLSYRIPFVPVLLHVSLTRGGCLLYRLLLTCAFPYPWQLLYPLYLKPLYPLLLYLQSVELYTVVDLLALLTSPPYTRLKSAQACVFVLLVYLATSVRARIVGLFCWRSYPPVRQYRTRLRGGRSGSTTRARACLFVVLPRGQRACSSCRQFVGGVALQSLHCNTCHVTSQTVVEEVE